MERGDDISRGFSELYWEQLGVYYPGLSNIDRCKKSHENTLCGFQAGDDHEAVNAEDQIRMEVLPRAQVLGPCFLFSLLLQGISKTEAREW